MQWEQGRTGLDTVVLKTDGVEGGDGQVDVRASCARRAGVGNNNVDRLASLGVGDVHGLAADVTRAAVLGRGHGSDVVVVRVDSAAGACNAVLVEERGTGKL